jgi:hypothetical protein
VVQEMRRGLPLRRGLAYPLLDRLCSLALMSGIAAGLPPGRPPPHSPARREPADPSLPSPARGHGDRLIMDLGREPLFLRSNEALTARVRQELAEVCAAILKALPHATVLLTGSLSVGEGRWAGEGQDLRCESDYDLVVLSGVPWPLALRLLRRHLEPRLQRRPLAAALDLACVWRPLLGCGWITTGGRIIAGDPAPAPLLRRLPAPRAATPLVNAFLTLAGARLARSPARFSDALGKALLRGAQAFLLHECRRKPRSEWIALGSVAGIRRRWRAGDGTPRPDLIRDLERAVALLAGEAACPWADSDYGRILDALREIRSRLPPPCGWRRLADRVLSAAHRGRTWLGSPPPLLEPLDSLADCWRDPSGPDGARLRALARSPCPGDPVAQFRSIHARFAATAQRSPHKLRWPARPEEGVAP